MGCGASKDGGPAPAIASQVSNVARVNSHGPAAGHESGRLSRTSSRQHSKSKLLESGSKRQKSFSKTPSGKEGRHGFVPLKEGSLGSKRENEDAVLDNDDTFFQKVSTASQKTGEAFQLAASKAASLLHRVSSEHLRASPAPAEAEGDEDGQPDFVLNVLFVFKKAVEFKNDLHITQHSLDGAMDKVVAALDSESSGQVPTSLLTTYIQDTCSWYNQVHGSQHGLITVPTMEQIQQAFSVLDMKSVEAVKSEQLKAALMGMDWGLLPA